MGNISSCCFPLNKEEDGERTHILGNPVGSPDGKQLTDASFYLCPIQSIIKKSFVF